MKLSLQVFVKSISLTEKIESLIFADIFELTNFFVKLLLVVAKFDFTNFLKFALGVKFTVLLTAKSFSRKVLKSLRCHP